MTQGVSLTRTLWMSFWTVCIWFYVIADTFSNPMGRLRNSSAGVTSVAVTNPFPNSCWQERLMNNSGPACTEFGRFQYGNTSSLKTYQSGFIPKLHDICQVFELRYAPLCTAAESGTVHADFSNCQVTIYLDF